MPRMLAPWAVRLPRRPWPCQRRRGDPFPPPCGSWLTGLAVGLLGGPRPPPGGRSSHGSAPRRPPGALGPI
eukprot:4555304-Prymnesium_polylepis.1